MSPEDLRRLVEVATTSGGCGKCGRPALPNEVPGSIDLDPDPAALPGWTCRACIQITPIEVPRGVAAFLSAANVEAKLAGVDARKFDQELTSYPIADPPLAILGPGGDFTREVRA